MQQKSTEPDLHIREASFKSTFLGSVYLGNLSEKTVQKRYPIRERTATCKRGSTYFQYYFE